MSKKQIVGILAAALAFVFICGSDYLIKNYVNNEQQKSQLTQSLLDSVENRVDLPTAPFVGVVKVDGTIVRSASSSLLESESYNHDKTLNLIEQYQNSDQNKGILLYLNTPGGGVYESDELYNKLLTYKQKTGRPVWAYMASEACSGGYYAAMAADKINANRNTFTGSIGVIISMSNYKGLMDKLGVQTVLYTSGRNKSMGNPGVNITEEQSQIFQGLIDESYAQFVGIVAKGRNMSVDTVKPIADGRIYSAQQALKLKLIDGIADYDSTVDQMTKALGGNVTIFTPKNKAKYLESLFSAAQSLTRSDADKVKELIDTQESGVPMYVAFTGE
ncbi:MAG TPA: signal peptide peptidase SppA [Caproiciproducens sp.]|nr:signal peptide peptidase SppA [Caproiciproducens sp.]